MQSIVRGGILAVIIASLSAACSPANNERADSATTVQHLFVGGQFVDLHAGLTRLLLPRYLKTQLFALLDVGHFQVAKSGPMQREN